MAFPLSGTPIIQAFNPPPFSVDPAGDVEAIGFAVTASGNALLVSIVGAPIVIAVNLDLADDEVAIGGPDAAGVRRLFQGRVEGANNIIETVPRMIGAQGDALGKVEDTAAAGDDVGVPAYAVRQDVPGSLVDADGDYSALQVDATGQLRVGGAAPTGLGKAEDAPAAAADVGVPAYAVRQDVPGSLVDTSGDYAPLQVDSVGRLYASQVPGRLLSTSISAPVAVGAASTPLLAASQARKALTIVNDGPGPLYVRPAGAGAVVTDIRIPAGTSRDFDGLLAQADWAGISNAATATVTTISGLVAV